MRAILVSESINFERGVDPKKSLQMGESRIIDFDTPKLFAEYLLDRLQKATGFNPSKNLANDWKYGSIFKDENFFRNLKAYYAKCPHTINGRPIV